MSAKRKVARKAVKSAAERLVKAFKGRVRDYIVRINVDTLYSVAVIRVPATSRKHAVELVKGALELTGEVAPLSLTEKHMNEEIVESAASEVVEEVAAEEAVESAE